MRITVSPAAFRRLAAAVAVAMGVVVVSGGAVRLTSSGLGCPTWPRCTSTSYVPAASFHGLVEFSNRMLGLVAGLLVLSVAVTSLLRSPRRRDLALLSWALVLGYVLQAVLGGLTVLYGLTPPWVMAHFLVSMLLLADAVLLCHRSDPRWAARRPVVGPEVVWLSRGLVAVAGAVLVLGTVVTGAGPHAGDASTPRLHLPLERATQLHADLALFLVGLIVATLVTLRVAKAPRHVLRRGNLLAAAVLLQVAIGYTQYFLGVPAGVVELHIAGATLLWSATLLLALAVTAPDPLPVTEPVLRRQPQRHVLGDRPEAEPAVERR